MCETAVQIIRKKDTQIIRPVRLKSTCGRIREVPHLLGNRLDLLSLCAADITVTVESLTDCSDGYIASLRDIFH